MNDQGRCPDCGRLLTLVGKAHRCVPVGGWPKEAEPILRDSKGQALTDDRGNTLDEAKRERERRLDKKLEGGVRKAATKAVKKVARRSSPEVAKVAAQIDHAQNAGGSRRPPPHPECARCAYDNALAQKRMQQARQGKK